jgi:hypothetical protein
MQRGAKWVGWQKQACHDSETVNLTVLFISCGCLPIAACRGHGHYRWLQLHLSFMGTTILNWCGTAYHLFTERVLHEGTAQCKQVSRSRDGAVHVNKFTRDGGISMLSTVWACNCSMRSAHTSAILRVSTNSPLKIHCTNVVMGHKATFVVK